MYREQYGEYAHWSKGKKGQAQRKQSFHWQYLFMNQFVLANIIYKKMKFKEKL